MPDWDEDSGKLSENLRKAYRLSRDEAHNRILPGIDLARQWHTTMMDGLDVPGDQYVGNFRGEDGLEGCEVHIGVHQGTPSTLVSQELEEFEHTLQKAVSALDQILPQGDAPSSRDKLNAVIELCAWVHSEWVRIHPFANGNGRTARIWTGFIAMRYGLPPFVKLRPRPDGGYGAACSKAMEGNWAPTAQVFRRMYLDVFL
ncbi:Fic family protein [Roseovarius tibetensis]|uniref:Fic family protein n=1 Tax=Roseovarius tibetensis TaxID=2685897 RepID=UPI003D7F4ACD